MKSKNNVEETGRERIKEFQLHEYRAAVMELLYFFFNCLLIFVNLARMKPLMNLSPADFTFPLSYQFGCLTAMISMQVIILMFTIFLQSKTNATMKTVRWLYFSTVILASMIFFLEMSMKIFA